MAALVVVSAPLLLDLVPPLSALPEGGFAEAAHIHHRVAIWKAYGEALQAVPWYGLGANADEVLGMSRSIVSVALQDAGYEPSIRSPHTFLLEWWVNFSIVGVFLVGGALGATGFALLAFTRLQAVAFTYVFVCVFTVASTATEFFQGWWIATILVGITLAALVDKPALNDGYAGQHGNPVAAGQNRA